MTSLWHAELPDLNEAPPVGGACEVLVVGAGAVGLTAAARLARAGRRVVVIDATAPGSGTTGRSTGKVTLLQGVRLGEVAEHNAPGTAAAYLESCRAGAEWIRAHRGSVEGGWEPARAYTLATTARGAESLDRELETARELGLPVERAHPAEAPFPVESALRLDDQLMLDPMALVRTLVALVRSAGGVVLAGCRVTDLESGGDGVRVTTSLGTLTAEHAIIATGTPIVDRGGHFARLQPSRSRVAAFRVPKRDIGGMHLCVDAEPASLRPARVDGVEYLVAAGAAAVVGRASSTAELAARLRDRVRELVPAAELAHEWAAQDYLSLDAAPYAGALDDDARLSVVTGFGKWGLAAGTGAALALAEELLGARPEWADRLYGRRPTLTDASTAVAWNAEVAGRLVGGYARSVTVSDDAPAEGQGRVELVGVHPTAVSRVDGVERRVSAVCTHLGGVLAWNDAECSWDCPLHGSRFAPDGRRIEGPALHDLAPRDR
ncbi:FAD-dependent oxidoreductase [Agromyces soli]